MLIKEGEPFEWPKIEEAFKKTLVKNGETPEDYMKETQIRKDDFDTQLEELFKNELKRIIGRRREVERH